MKGRIKFFSENEGYGFIQGEDGIEYYFDIHGIYMDPLKLARDFDNFFIT